MASTPNIRNEVLSLRAHAKINLFLKVVEKRQDGYHNIETVFIPLSNIFDTIKLRLSNNPGIKITSSSTDIPCDSSNLCYRAAELYASQAQIDPEWEINIDKHIPVTAGMGGGSSDAAAVLRLLQKIYDNILKEKELNSIAAQIGADVPFFLNPVSSAGYGVGNILNPIKIEHDFYVLICALQFPVTAAWSYTNMKQPGICKDLNINRLISSMEIGDIPTVLKFVKNDLAPALYSKFPILAILKHDLMSLGTEAVEITGSGPTIFGICKYKTTAEQIASSMEERYGTSLKIAISAILM